MTAVPKPEKITTEEYFRLTAESQERTELWQGVIVNMPSPSELHQDITGGLYAEIRSFIRNRKGSCKALISPFDVCIDEENVVQPDVMVVCDRSKLDGKRCHGTPDWVIEVTSTNRGDDFDRKLFLYLRSGVRKYWIVDTLNKKVIIYDFEHHPNVISFYDWTDSIPVGIYGGALQICIADLL